MAALLDPSAALGAHPLITEDTGTQGRGNWQLELTYDQGHDREAGLDRLFHGTAAVLSYGVTDALDVIAAVPYERDASDGMDDEADGLGDVELGGKWRFFRRGDLSLAVRPGLALPTGDSDRGLGAGRVVPSLYMVTSYEPGRWGFHLHVGYTYNDNVASERRHIVHGSLAVTRGIGERLRLVGDLSSDSNPDPASDTDVRSVVLGAIYSVTPWFDLDLGYRRGLTEPATHHAWLAGVTLRF